MTRAAAVRVHERLHRRALRRPRASRAIPFWDRVDRSGGSESCWPWIGSRDRFGYGRYGVHIPSTKKTRSFMAHRFAFQSANGLIPPGLVICHRCDNPPCCNPAHLFAGTQADNIADCVSKGRQARIRGENHASARLTWAEVYEIRARRTSTRTAAALFGVSPTLISRIRLGLAWRESTR